jgi:nitrogen regulatory protein P-II 1
LKKVEAIFRPEKLESVAASLDAAGFHGFTVTDARGHGRSAEKVGEWRGVAYEMLVTHKLQISVVAEDEEVEAVARAIAQGAATGQVGDGLITVIDLAAVYPIRSGPLTSGMPTPSAT